MWIYRVAPLSSSTALPLQQISSSLLSVNCLVFLACATQYYGKLVHTKLIHRLPRHKLLACPKLHHIDLFSALMLKAQLTGKWVVLTLIINAKLKQLQFHISQNQSHCCQDPKSLALLQPQSPNYSPFALAAGLTWLGSWAISACSTSDRLTLALFSTPTNKWMVPRSEHTAI